MKMNLLNEKRYMISPELQNLLKNSISQDYKLREYKEIKKDNGCYLVFIRRPDNSDDFYLHYNYYPKDFIVCLLWYFCHRSENETFVSKEIGSYLIYFDTKFFEDNTDISILNKNWGNMYEDMISREFNLLNIYNLLNTLSFIGDKNSIIDVINLASKRNISDFVNNIIGEKMFTNLKSKSLYIDEIELNNFNILKNCIFLIDDINEFTSLFKSKGFKINEGPQKWRGQINSMNKQQVLVDLDFRKSLENNNKYHIKNGLGSENELPKKTFSFENIHNNIGNVRWYSTFIRGRNSSNNLNTFSNKRNFSTETSNKINRQDIFVDNYRNIKNIISDNGNIGSEKLEREIESFLYNQEINFSANNILNIKINYNEDVFNLIETKKKEIQKYLENPSLPKGNNSLIKDDYMFWVKKAIEEIGSNKISHMILEYFFEVLTKDSIQIDDNDTPGIPTLKSYETLGGYIINRYIYSLYLKERKNLKEGIDISLYDFKSKNKEIFKDFNQDNYNVFFGSFFVQCLVETKLLYQDLDKSPWSYKEKMWYFRVNIDIRKKILTDNYRVFHIPSKLPMVWPPKDFIYTYDDEGKGKIKALGGYLENDVRYTDEIFKDKPGYEEKTKLLKNNVVVDLVNGISKTPYKVNMDTLNFINKFGIEKGVIIDDLTDELKSFHKDPYKKVRNREELRSKYSKMTMEKNILSIADAYSKLDKIYFPVRLDARTRLYCETDFFDYQNHDLAKGLLCFSNPGIITKDDTDAIMYLKVFGASMYGNGLDKKSFEVREKWVDDNVNKILNFENNNIINESEEKCCFISFCFEYKRFIEFMSNIDSVKFYTYLPIQLDASCNGYQHLTLLTKETKLLERLNLRASSRKDSPDDWYYFVIEKTNNHIEKKINILSKVKNKTTEQSKVLSHLEKLYKLNFDRNVIKRPVMTKSFNATIPSLIEKIAKQLKEVWVNKKRYYLYKNSDIKIDRDMISTFVVCMRDVIEIEAPRIKKLSNYVGDLVSICTRLSIPFPWILPSGVEITQSYKKKNQQTLKAFSFVKRSYTFTMYEKDKYDYRKQKRAAMPNIIHSLDASTIALLFNKLDKKPTLYTVHDCFASTADNMNNIIQKLKLVYLEIYSNNNYLLQIDQTVKSNINKMFGDRTYKMGDNIVNIYKVSPQRKKESVETVSFPDVNEILTYNTDNSIDIKDLMNSSYIIS